MSEISGGEERIMTHGLVEEKSSAVAAVEGGGVWLASTAAHAAVGADGGGRRVVDVQVERAADKLL